MTTRPSRNCTHSLARSTRVDQGQVVVSGVHEQNLLEPQALLGEADPALEPLCHQPQEEGLARGEVHAQGLVFVPVAAECVVPGVGDLLLQLAERLALHAVVLAEEDAVVDAASRMRAAPAFRSGHAEEGRVGPVEGRRVHELREAAIRPVDVGGVEGFTLGGISL